MGARRRLVTALALALVTTGIVSLFFTDIPMVAAVVAILLGVSLLLTMRWLAPTEPAGEVVLVDDQGVRRHTTDGREERIAWDDLVQVSIVTTEEGPFSDDLFFLLQADDGTGCIIASEQAEETGLVGRLQRLPRFDNEALLQASGCTVDAHFICWQGAPGEGVAAAQPSGPRPSDPPPSELN
jgi:hypothetical protein